MNIVLFGPPGAGKGTQATDLSKKYDMAHLSTGDLFRKAIKDQTEVGKQVQSILKTGALVPDKTTIAVLQEAIVNSGKEGFLFDGFPRNVAQADALNELFRHQDMKLDKAVFLEVPKEDIIERLSGRRSCPKCASTYHVKHKAPKVAGVCDVCGTQIEQRPDDKEDVIKKRLEVYEENTLPLKDYYKKMGKFVAVNGVGSPAAVFDRIVSAVGTH